MKLNQKLFKSIVRRRLIHLREEEIPKHELGEREGVCLKGVYFWKLMVLQKLKVVLFLYTSCFASIMLVGLANCGLIMV